MDDTHLTAPAMGIGASSPLDRLLRPRSSGALEASLRAHSAPGDLVLDPFAGSDALAHAAARTSRRAILTDVNPLVAFAIRAGLSSIPTRELHRAFTWLGNALTHQTLLRIHVDELYATACPRCAQPAIARYFIWRRDRNEPVGKACACDFCRYITDEANGLDAVDEFDIAAIQRIDARPAMARLFRRAAPDGDAHGEELVGRLLDLYTTRALYAIDALLAGIERGAESSTAEAALKLMLLHCLDVGSKLAPSIRTPNARLTLEPLPEFRERNIWQAFEEGYEIVRRLADARAAASTVPQVTTEIERLLNPEPPDDLSGAPDVFVDARRPRELAFDLVPGSVGLILSELPAPNRSALYALSYLWTGWLIGPDAAEPLLDLALETTGANRPAPGWPAYYRHLRESLLALLPLVRDGGRLILTAPSDDPYQVDVAALAAVSVGLRLEAVRFHPADTAATTAAAAYGGAPGQYALELVKPAEWRELPERANGIVLRELTHEIAATAREAIYGLLAQRNEPAPWSRLNAAILERLGETGALLRLIQLLEDSPGQALRVLAGTLRDDLELAVRRGAFVRLEVEREFGGGVLWTLPAVSGQPPLAERVERSVYNVLATARSIGDAQLDAVVQGLFSGHTAADPGLVRELLASYGHLTPGGWTLRIPDQFKDRTLEHRRVMGWLVELGHRLEFRAWVSRNEHLRGYRTTTLKDLLSPQERAFNAGQWLGNQRAEEIDVVWYGPGRPTLIFEVEWMATLTDAVLRRRSSHAGVRRYLIVPPDRLTLIRQRLARNTLLRQTFAYDGWTILDYAELGALEAVDGVDLERAVHLLGLDGLRSTASTA